MGSCETLGSSLNCSVTVKLLVEERFNACPDSPLLPVFEVENVEEDSESNGLFSSKSTGVILLELPSSSDELIVLTVEIFELVAELV